MGVGVGVVREGGRVNGKSKQGKGKGKELGR